MRAFEAVLPSAVILPEMSVRKTWIDGRGTTSGVLKKKEDFLRVLFDRYDVESADDAADIWINDDLRSETSPR
jgi:hypothetical protein